MTVKELIEKLETIQDKDMKIAVGYDSMTYDFEPEILIRDNEIYFQL